MSTIDIIRFKYTDDKDTMLEWKIEFNNTEKKYKKRTKKSSNKKGQPSSRTSTNQEA